MNVQAGLGTLFPGAVTEWNVHQKAMAYWLRIYDSFYEKCRSQHYVSDVEPVKPWMAEYDVIVDAFFDWYEYMSNRKKDEQAQWHDPNVPRVTDHEGPISRSPY